jgi:flagellar basal-body rod modification protein FlgD
MTPFGSVQSSITNTSDPAAGKTATGSTAPLASQDTFLQLLVAQLKNQDPLQPQDGSAFVAQLAQFSNLDQAIGSRQDLDAIRQALTTVAPEAVTP